MQNKDIILFIIVIIVVYLLYKMNKLNESFTNSKESFTNGEIGITESIKNLGIIAKEIQKDDNYKFPGNIVIPNGSKIIFEGPGGKLSEIFFNPNLNGLEIAQRGGASNIRLFQGDTGIDIGDESIRINTDLDISLGKKIKFEGDGDKFSEIFYNNITSDGLEIAQRGGASKIRFFQNTGGFDIGMNTIKTAGGDSLVLGNNIQLSVDKKITFEALPSAGRLGPQHMGWGEAFLMKTLKNLNS